MKKAWIKLIAISSLALELGCQGIPKPKGYVGVIHSKDVNAPYIHEFNMQTDFDENLHVLPGHNGVHRLLHSLTDLDRGIWLSADSYAELSSYQAKIKARVEQCLRH